MSFFVNSLDEVLGQFVCGSDTHLSKYMHVEGEASAHLSVEIGCHLYLGHLLDKELQSWSDIEVRRHLVGVKQTFQKNVHLLLVQFIQKHCNA